MSPRFYFPKPLNPNTEVILSEAQYRHLQALRCKVGEFITLFDGQGASISAQLTEINKKFAKVSLANDLTQQAPPSLQLHLGQALCRADRMDLILQKAVELNVSAITPLYAERSQGRLAAAQLERKMAHWQDILISAAEQCQQDYLPSLHPPVALAEWLRMTQAELKLQCTLENAHSLKQYTKAPTSCALLVGPEGGLTPSEMLLADQAQFQRISLGARVLRVETAAILALGLVSYQFI